MPHGYNMSMSTTKVPRSRRPRVDPVRAALERLADAQSETQAELRTLVSRVEELAQAQRHTEERLEKLAQQVGELAEAQRRTEHTLADLIRSVKILAEDVGDLKGEAIERRYRERAASFFETIARRIRVVDHQTLGELLDDAVDAGRVTADEKREVMHTDVVLAGRRDAAPVYVLAEVSAVIDPDDVGRAARRSALLRKATGTDVIPAVAGQRILDAAKTASASAGVWRVLDGIVTAPNSERQAP